MKSYITCISKILTNLCLSLSYFEDKRIVLDDAIHTLAYFHKDLKKNRFLQMIINKKRFKKIFADDQRFTEIKISAYK